MSGSIERDPHHERRWRILGVIALAQLMVVLDVTIVTIALPSAQADLGFDPDSRQWVMTAYALAFGSLLLLGGKISDLIGRKWTFIAGLVGFAGASAVGGAASSFEVLVGARALQGAFAALLAPAALSIVTTTFTDPAERGKAFGIYGAIASAGAAVGLLLGGFLTELLTWRWTMYLNLGFAIPAAIAGGRLLVNMRPAERPRIDVPGVLVATSGLFALVYGFSNAEMDSWSAPLTIGLLGFGVVAVAAFVAIERRVAAPLLPLRVVGDRNRGAAFLAVAVTGVAAFATFLFLTYYLQQGLGFSPIEAGLAFLPMVVAVFATGPVAATKLLPACGAARTGPLRDGAVGAGPRVSDRNPRGLLLRGSGPARDHGRGRRLRPDDGAVLRDRDSRASRPATRAWPRRWSTRRSRSGDRWGWRCCPPCSPTRSAATRRRRERRSPWRRPRPPCTATPPRSGGRPGSWPRAPSRRRCSSSAVRKS